MNTHIFLPQFFMHRLKFPYYLNKKSYTFQAYYAFATADVAVEKDLLASSSIIGNHYLGRGSLI